MRTPEEDFVFRSDIAVELRQHIGSDDTILDAMLVSTGKDLEERDPIASLGRINFLTKNRHGTPFEHASLTFRIEAPIFVWREFHRHRIGFSYNEESGRYKQLDPVFYVPGPERKLQQVGKPGAYEYVEGDEVMYNLLCSDMRQDCRETYWRYEDRLEAGVAKEVARMTLPVNIYSACYVTCNPRSLMSFLSLRTNRPEAKFPSKPMREIEMAAEQMEEHFQRLFPLTHKTYDANGRVAP